METIQTTKYKMTAKDFFLYLGILVTLYVSSIALVSFLFNAIDLKFLENTNYYNDPTNAIAWSLSVFMVFYPILIVLISSSINSIRKSPEKKTMSIRNWFIYLTLFVTILTMAIDLIVLINTFLSGNDITIGFILKTLSVISVAGVVFYFTIEDLKGTLISNPKFFRNLKIATSTVILIMIVSGFFLIGSPSESRNRIEDSTRESDLSSIQYNITNFWQQKSRLPNNLEELVDPLTLVSLPVDPDTGLAYEYKVLGENKFELCATFETSSTKFDNESTLRPYSPVYTDNGFTHKAERTCFERTIDPELFPPIKN